MKFSCILSCASNHHCSAVRWQYQNTVYTVTCLMLSNTPLCPVYPPAAPRVDDNGIAVADRPSTPMLTHVCTPAVTGKRSYKHLVGADGSIKSVVRKGDAVIDAATLGPKKGKSMLVACGRHAGVKCTVLEVDADGREGACPSLLEQLTFAEMLMLATAHAPHGAVPTLKLHHPKAPSCSPVRDTEYPKLIHSMLCRHGARQALAE